MEREIEIAQLPLLEQDVSRVQYLAEFKDMCTRDTFVSFIRNNKGLNAPAPIARYQTPHLIQNFRSY